MSMRFTEELRQASIDTWERVINHRFTTELANGTISRAVIKKYLIQDHRFLDAFVVLLASVIANVRTLQDRIPGCQFLALITGKENTYFERAFRALEVSDLERSQIPNDSCTTGFIDLMRAVSKQGTLGEMLSVLVVCEWSYLSWGLKVAEQTNSDDFVTYEWVDLHSGDSFQAVVDYIRDLLDREATYMDSAQRDACHRRFRQTIELEEDFFENAYS